MPGCGSTSSRAIRWPYKSGARTCAENRITWLTEMVSRAFCYWLSNSSPKLAFFAQNWEIVPMRDIWTNRPTRKGTKKGCTHPDAASYRRTVPTQIQPLSNKNVPTQIRSRFSLFTLSTQSCRRRVRTSTVQLAGRRTSFSRITTPERGGYVCQFHHPTG